MRKYSGNAEISKSLYVKHVLILSIGYLAGLYATYYFLSIPFDFSHEIRKARELGIVSVSVLANYPKTQDVLSYVSLIGIPFLFSVIPWYVWAKNKKNSLQKILVEIDEEREDGRRPLLWVLATMIFYMFVTFNINRFYAPGYNPFVGAWPFLGEDGENLAWAQSILSGGVYGKDFFCLYGPMLVYPLSWAMKMFGTTVVVERGLRYFFDILAYGIIIFFLFKTIRLRIVFIISSIIYLFLYYPPSHSVNFTYLRFILGILPFLIINFYLNKRNKILLMLAGAVIGQSILFSQEAGSVSLVICFFMLFLFTVESRQWRSFCTDCFVLSGGMFISLTPMILFLTAKGSMGSFLDSLYGFPRIKTLGYGSLPFTSFKDFVLNPLDNSPIQYWIILFYSIMAPYLISRFIVARNKKVLYLQIALLMYGIILFRIPVGRPYIDDTWKVFHPGILLFCIYLDTTIMTLMKGKYRQVKLVSILLALFFIGSFVVFTSDLLTNKLQTLNHEITDISQKWTLRKTGLDLPRIERGGIFYSRMTAGSILQIKGFLDKYAQDETYVYFFPNEAAYYFIFDKQNPTRYAIAYFAATTKQQRELISDLEEKKPTYIVYSLKTWRIDDIAEEIQVPLVVEYINRNYKRFAISPNILILKRKTSR